jgi:hypothetical protein
MEVDGMLPNIEITLAIKNGKIFPGRNGKKLLPVFLDVMYSLDADPRWRLRVIEILENGKRGQGHYLSRVLWREIDEEVLTWIKEQIEVYRPFPYPTSKEGIYLWGTFVITK